MANSIPCAHSRCKLNNLCALAGAMPWGQARTLGCTGTGRRHILAGAIALQRATGVAEPFAGCPKRCLVAVFAWINDSISTNGRSTGRSCPTTNIPTTLQLDAACCSRWTCGTRFRTTTGCCAIRLVLGKGHAYQVRAAVVRRLAGFPKLGGCIGLAGRYIVSAVGVATQRT